MVEAYASWFFGDSYWGDDPWYQYDATEAKQVSHACLDFLHTTVGLYGTYHDHHGWLIDMDLWAALKLYVQHCIDNQEDFLFHTRMVEGDDLAYMVLATKRMSEFLNKVKSVK